MSPLNPDLRPWRSLGELEGSPEVHKYIDREFTESARDFPADGTSRRRFIQLMGASLAFAGVAGCKRWEEEKIVPLARRPEGYVPGVPKYFATAFELGGAASGLVVTSYDGRPTKIEGNPDHPFTTGASSAFAQASILTMYDPDRSSPVISRSGGKASPSSWAEADDALRGLAAGGGAGVRVLAEATSSPTVARLRAELQAKLPQLQWHEFEPLSRDNVRAGTKLAFGAPFEVVPRLDKADVILAVDDDLFHEGPAATRVARDFARRRDPETGKMNRLYAVESTFTGTGGMADHRLPLRSELALPFLLAVEAKVTGGSAPSAEFLSDAKVAKFVEVVAKDLREHRGRGAVTAGYRQPAEVHAVVARLNSALANAGAGVTYVPAANPNRPTHGEDIASLTKAMAGGQVQTLLILGGNPVYNAPGFAEALGNVKTKVHLGDYDDETSAACDWHLPRAHFLETWGDARSLDGTVTLTQPIIDPLHGGRSDAELLSLLVSGRAEKGQALVRATFETLPASQGWRKALHDGFVAGSAPTPAVPNVQSFPTPTLSPRQTGGLETAEPEVVFTASSQTFDGRYANNAWLLETPDFMTKLTWDNAALVGPATARKLKVKQGDLVNLAVGERSVKAAVYIMPGQAKDSIALALGWGRTRAGVVGGSEDEGVAPAGFNAYEARSGADYIASAKLTPAGGTYALATTQMHWAIEDRGREAIAVRANAFVQKASLKKYKEKPEFVKDLAHDPHTAKIIQPKEADKPENDLSLFSPPVAYDGYKWGLATDLSKCTGCNACSVACQSENNVPVVGKEQVINNREMHWMRIDRYFIGDPESPTLSHQPVMCQQCEKAPCEQVCPVGATVHSSEGLNDMVYNRCVGTRYCANNCPYKVRRFNFLNYNKEHDEPKNKLKKLMYNPEVTVRSRGVMEKCTFCVQRIQAVRIDHKKDNSPIQDGEIQTACMQACPTEAIVFGDLNDKSSRVAKLHAQERAYTMLFEYNTKPRNAYLARITNQHPDLADESAAGAHGGGEHH